MELSEAKEFLRIDGTDHDNNLTALIGAGKVYIEGATGKPYSSQPLEVMCLKLLLVNWFDQDTRKIPHGVDSLLMQIAYS